MGIFSNLFGNKKKNNQETKSKHIEVEIDETPSNGLSFGISFDENKGITFSTSPVGTSTGSNATDFYVYEWYIKDTGEIFYVGKGRGERYKSYHERAYEAERIRKSFDTDIRFVGTDLTEDEAIVLESKEMLRILNETNDRLTNRIIPLFAKRGNGYDRSPNTPELKFETAPHFYACEIDDHYFGKKSRPFDKVEDENLKSVVFITRSIRDEIEIIYGGNPDKYLTETKAMLTKNGSKTLKSQYAKSVTAWIFIGEDDVMNYELDQQKALERIGRNIPTYHLIDVWKFLKDKLGEVEIPSTEEVIINPIHNRIPLKEIRNLNNWSKGFDEGKPYWDKGEEERKAGNLIEAIELYDLARYNGYNAPVLYSSYTMAYRKLKDYDNEIAIIDEAIERLRSENVNVNEIHLLELKDRRAKAIELKQKRKK